MAKIAQDRDVKTMTMKELGREFVEVGVELKECNLSSWLAARKEVRRTSLAMEIANRVNKRPKRKDLELEKKNES